MFRSAGSEHPMRSPRPWCFSHPTTAATSRERNCLWTAASRKYRQTLIIIEGYKKMKKNLHPTVRQVVFKDVSSDFSFLGTSVDSKETIKWEDGKSYPLIKVEVSSASHPFFTGKQRVLDTEGRIGRFKKKYGKKVNYPRRISRLDQGELINPVTP